MFLGTEHPRLREALSERVSHKFTADSARFDEDNLVSFAGLVPVLGLAEQTRLPQIIEEKVSIKAPRIKSGSANPVPKAPECWEYRAAESARPVRRPWQRPPVGWPGSCTFRTA